MSSQLHDQYVPIGSAVVTYPSNVDRTQPILVVVLMPGNDAPASTGNTGTADAAFDEEPTWEDAEWC